jgi:hypothetical protein
MIKVMAPARLSSLKKNVYAYALVLHELVYARICSNLELLSQAIVLE